MKIVNVVFLVVLFSLGCGSQETEKSGQEQSKRNPGSPTPAPGINTNNSIDGQNDTTIPTPNTPTTGDIALDSFLGKCLPLDSKSKDVCEIEFHVHQFTNKLRQEKNRDLLEYDPQIGWASRVWSQAQATGSSFFSWFTGGLSHAGFPSARRSSIKEKFGSLTSSLMMENVAMFGGYGDRPAKEIAERFVMKQWRNSPGHYKNIMAKGIRLHGAGVFRNSNGEYFATQIMGNPDK